MAESTIETSWLVYFDPGGNPRNTYSAYTPRKHSTNGRFLFVSHFVTASLHEPKSTAKWHRIKTSLTNIHVNITNILCNNSVFTNFDDPWNDFVDLHQTNRVSTSDNYFTECQKRTYLHHPLGDDFPHLRSYFFLYVSKIRIGRRVTLFVP